MIILPGVFPNFPVMRHQSDPDFKDSEISLYVQVHRPKVNKMISYKYMHLLNINFTMCLKGKFPFKICYPVKGTNECIIYNVLYIHTEYI